MVQPATARTRVTRRIAADPTSTALLLATPSAVELWPGVRRVGAAAGRLLVEAVLPPQHRPAAASVLAGAPRRTPTSYVTVFEWDGPGLPAASGTLTLAYAPSPDGIHVTHAVLELDCPELAASGFGRARLQAMAAGFLANLGRAAESRSRAA